MRPSNANYQPGTVNVPDRTTHYTYDLLGRLITVSEDSTQVNTTDPYQLHTDYTFDLVGRADTTTTRTL